MTRLPVGWVWIAVLGVGMLVGGALAWLIAATRVVLPYDEAFVGLSRAELEAVNHRLLAFLAHDRVTLAGSMLATGVLYAGLALQPLRRGEAWAWRATIWSSVVGFSSFLLFIGFGYFDPLHAVVSTALLLCFMLGVSTRPKVTSTPTGRPPRRSWGQFLFVAVGTGLLLAGMTLATIGVTVVFVPEDLAFMGTSREALEAASPRLIPLIAHDRATLGGMLTCNGLLVLLTSLWGYRPGAGWLWWTLLASGAPGFVAALGTHAAVGYTDLGHLAPALAGAVLYGAGLVVAYPELIRSDARVTSDRLAR